jgi:hypothetical protein
MFQISVLRIRNIRVWTGVALAVGIFALSSARAAKQEVFTAKLPGDNEVPPINSAGSAMFQMEIDTSTATPTIHFTVTYANVSTSPTLSHLHFAPTGVAGGVMIFLCGGGGQAPCPTTTSGSFSGTITPANVTGPTAQGIDAGDLVSALEAVQDGDAYANLHTTKFPAGEIRGQVHRGNRDRDKD